MARIPDEEIERLKKEVHLAELVARIRGRAAQSQAQDLVGRCPFHDDDTPSLVVTPGEEPVALPGGLPGGRVGHRLGDAHPGGELPPRRRAAARRPGASDRSGPCPRCAQTSVRQAAPPARAPTPATPRLLAQVVDYYHADPARLARGPRLTSPGARSTTLTLIERFPPRVTPTAPSATACPTKQTKDGAEVRGRLQRLGVLRDVRPRALQRLARRPGLRHLWRRRRDATAASSTDDLRTGHAAHLYLPGPAPRRLERGRPRRRRGDPLRVAHRRAQLLVLRVSQRHRLLRHRRLHRRPPARPSRATASRASSSPTTTTKPATPPPTSWPPS